MRWRGNNPERWIYLTFLVLSGLFSAVHAEPLQFVSSHREQLPARAHGPSVESLSGKRNALAVNLIRSDETGIEIEVLNPAFDSYVEEVEGQLYHHLSLDNATLSQQEGKPQLPLRVVMLGIPLEVDVDVEVVEVETQRSFGYHVYPASKKVLSETSLGEPFTTTEFYRDEHLYGQNVFYPPQLAKVTQTAFVRNQRIAKLEVCPFQFNPTTGELLFHKRLVLRLNFVGEPQADLPGLDEPDLVRAAEDPFEPILENILLNYESSRRWRRRRVDLPTPKLEEGEVPYGDSTAYKFTLSENGIYSMSYEYLQSQGVDVSTIDPRTVKIYNRGEQIPIYVHGVRDGSFDPGDRIQFWGEVCHGDEQYYSPYTEKNVYWLVSGGSIGLRMVEQDGSLRVEDPDSLIIPTSYKTILRMEEDLSYQRLTQVSDESIDRWLGDELGAGDTLTYTFWTNAVDDSGEAEIEVRLRGVTFPEVPGGGHNHHTRIWLNGFALKDAWWSDQSEFIYHRTDLPNSNVWEGKNVLTIKSVPIPEIGDVDEAYMNWFQIDYWRGYVARNNYLEFGPPEGGERGLYEFTVSGFTRSDIELFDLAGKKIVNFQVSQDSIGYTIKFQDRVLRDTRYVALTESNLNVPIEVYRNKPSNLRSTANGADYIIITHSDFYESVLPLAAYRESQGLRTKVVLVQDIYDEFNDGILSPQAIRDFLQYAFEMWQQPAPTYVLLVGDTSWGYDKSIAQQAHWRQKCFVPTVMAWTSAWGASSSDNRLVCIVGEDKLPDMAIGRFPVSTKEEADVVVSKVLAYETNPEIGPWRRRIQLLAGELSLFEQGCVELDSSYIPPCYEVTRLYTRSGSVYYGTTQDLVRQWETGIVLASFAGHGGGSVWFDAQLFTLDDVILLNNGQRLPVVFSLTCFVGYFDNPWYSSLGEEILRKEEGGAVAHFGSSGVAWAYEDNLLGHNLFEVIFQDEERAVGIVTTQSKLGPLDIGRELTDVFNLLGDPAMKIALPEHRLSLDLADNSLPLGEAISVQGTVPGSPDGTAMVAFCDRDTSGWSADTTGLSLVDKSFAPRIPVVQETISVTNGQFHVETLPPDTIPEHPLYDLTPGRKSVTAYFWNQETDAIGWSPLNLDTPYLDSIWHEPERPIDWEETRVFARVDVGSGLDPDGPDSVVCRWSNRRDLYPSVDLNMSTEDGITYKTDAPIIAAAREDVYYAILVWYGGVGGAPSPHFYQSGIMTYRVHTKPNLAVAQKDVSLFVKGDSLWIGCWVHNKSVVDIEEVVVRFFDDRPDSNHPIGSDQVISVVPAEDSALAQVSWDGPGEPHDLYVWVDPEGNIEEQVNYDNKTHRYFSNLFLGTPQHGTTVRGSNARVSHTSGNVACNISAGSLGQSSLLCMDEQAPDGVYYVQKYDPLSLDQPDLSFAALKDSSYNLYRLAFEDSLLDLNGSATIAIWYNPNDSLTQLAVQENNLRICYLLEQIDKWILLSDQEMVVDSSMVQASVSHFGLFGLFIVDDQKPPEVKISVEGQSFANGDYISARPVIFATIEDENGVDSYSHPVEITLNGNPVASSDFSSASSPRTSNLCLVTYMPELDPDFYILTMRAYDCFGNSAADSINFNVITGFQIPWVANHPNPFQTETVIAYVVASDSPAEQVIIKIYTVRGKLIRVFQDRNVGPGYVEIIWDGRDSDGVRVANGVYYYKLTAMEGDGKKMSPILGKMAKLE